nr:MAG TPA: hypothetical protein [Caudoviricetes sp.]
MHFFFRRSSISVALVSSAITFLKFERLLKLLFT